MTPPSQVKAERPEFIKLANQIAGKNRPLNFSWDGQPAKFAFSNQRLAPRGGWTLGMSLGGHDLRVELSRLPGAAWISPTLAGIDLLSLPPELACAVVEASLGDIFAALSKTGLDAKITSVQEFAFRDAPEEVIEWCLDRGSETGWMRGYVTGGDAALQHLANLMQKVATTPSLEDEKLPVPVVLVAGVMTASLKELEAVELHDVLLADLGAFSSLRQCQLRAGRKLLGVGVLEQQAFALKQLISNSTPMDTTAKNVPVNDLEIELTFVAGQSTLSVGELKSLAPGFVFELDAPAGEQLTICANGKPIGRGELLQVGDRMGVRVTAFSLQ